MSDHVLQKYALEKNILICSRSFQGAFGTYFRVDLLTRKAALRRHCDIRLSITKLVFMAD